MNWVHTDEVFRSTADDVGVSGVSPAADLRCFGVLGRDLDLEPFGVPKEPLDRFEDVPPPRPLTLRCWPNG